MRAGGCAVQQTLTSEAASVLKHSLTLARRRGHAQVTSLHVAATLLSSRSSLLRRACLKSQPTNHPLLSRALELCFNVALNRLPTTPAPLLHGQPSLSNALIAALKRAQAHQRRGCIEQHQQQPLLTIKVELEQLIISILDDPSVSRVMREAGFSSTAVKTNVEDAASSSVFHCYGAGATNAAGVGVGVFSSPCSPTSKHQNPNPTSTFWPTHFLSYSDHHHRNPNPNPLLFSSSASPPPQKKPLPAAVQETDVKSVLEALTKRRNTVVVGDTAEATVAEVMKRVERGEGPPELLRFAPVVTRFMKRADVEMNITELKKKVDASLATGSTGGVVIYVGDMKWTVEIVSPAGEYNPTDEMVGEVARLVTQYNEKVWLMGTASNETRMRFQIRQPSIQLQWDLHVVSVPSADLSLTLRANPSVLDSKVGLSDDKQEQLCVECKSGYEKEAQLFKSTNRHKLLPPWLQPQGQETNNQKDDLAELRKKWNRLCHHNHNYSGQNPRTYARSFSYSSTYPWWPTNSISFIDSPMKSSNSVPRFRRQDPPTIEFNLGVNGHKAQEPSLDCLRHSTQGKEVRVTLELGSSGKSEDDKNCTNELHKILLDNVPWQSETIPSVVEALTESKSRKNENWLLIQGNDRIGKRRLAHAIAESICGSSDLVLHMNMRKAQKEVTPNSEILGTALGNHDKLVIFVEDVDLADAEFLKFLSDGHEIGNLGESWTKRKLNNSSCRAVFVLTKTDGGDWKRDQDSVIQMTLNVTETAPSPGFTNSPPDRKRKAQESDSPRKSGRIDLNIEVIEHEEGEESAEKPREVITSGFLEAIENRFVFERRVDQEREAKERVEERMRGSYEEVFGDKGRDRFRVEERVVGEVVEGCGTFVDSSFEKWLKDVFQTSLRRVKKGGKGIGIKMELCYGGKGKQGEGVLWDGFMGSSLPKNIHVVSSLH